MNTKTKKDFDELSAKLRNNIVRRKNAKNTAQTDASVDNSESTTDVITCHTTNNADHSNMNEN